MSHNAPGVRTNSGGRRADATARGGAPRRGKAGSWFRTRWPGRSAFQERIQVHEHPGRGSPDVVLLIRYRVVMALAAFVYDAVALVVRGIEQELQGHFEHFGHLEFVEPELKRRGHEANHRGHPIAGHRYILMQFSEHFHSRGRKTDFLRGLPQGSLRGVRVSGLGAAAGKTDLSGMVVEVRGTARKQNRKPALAPYQRHEHGGGPDFPITAPKVAVSRSHRLDRSRLGKTRAHPEFVRRGDG